MLILIGKMLTIFRPKVHSTLRRSKTREQTDCSSERNEAYDLLTQRFMPSIMISFFFASSIWNVECGIDEKPMPETGYV